MITWSKDELGKIAEADDLHISLLRADQVTYGTPTRIWSVALATAPMCAPTTGRTRVGTRPRCVRRRDGSKPPALRRRSRSSRSRGWSTTSSTMPTGRSITAARISAR
jgi:hypothetical protein